MCVVVVVLAGGARGKSGESFLGRPPQCCNEEPGLRVWEKKRGEHGGAYCKGHRWPSRKGEILKMQENDLKRDRQRKNWPQNLTDHGGRLRSGDYFGGLGWHGACRVSRITEVVKRSAILIGSCGIFGFGVEILERGLFFCVRMGAQILNLKKCSLLIGSCGMWGGGNGKDPKGIQKDHSLFGLQFIGTVLFIYLGEPSRDHAKSLFLCRGTRG